MTLEGSTLTPSARITCSSCNAPLKVSEADRSNYQRMARVVLACEYCGTATSFDDAERHQAELRRLLDLRFGHLASAIATGGSDIPLRSYVFQRDVVDYLAGRFVTTARFLNPEISTPGSVVELSIREEMEYGLELGDYLAGLSVDATLPDNPEIGALAGTPADLAEGRSQAQKVRALMYYTDGLRELREASSMIAGGRLAHETTVRFEHAEVYFVGAAKICGEAQGAFPEHPFYPVFARISSGAARFSKAVRLHACGYWNPSILDDAIDDFSAVASAGSLHLSRSKQASVFADPSKAKLRQRVESRFLESARTNAARVVWYRDEVASFPQRVAEVTARARESTERFLRSKRSSFLVGLGLILAALVALALGFLAITVVTALSVGSFVSALVAVVLLGLILGNQAQNRRNLVNDYSNFIQSIAFPLKRRIDVLTGNSASVAYHYIRPLDVLHGLFMTKILALGWVLTSEVFASLRAELSSLPVWPPPLDSPPPPSFLTPLRNRPMEEYRQNVNLDQVRQNLSAYVFTNPPHYG